MVSKLLLLVIDTAKYARCWKANFCYTLDKRREDLSAVPIMSHELSCLLCILLTL